VLCYALSKICSVFLKTDERLKLWMCALKTNTDSFVYALQKWHWLKSKHIKILWLGIQSEVDVWCGCFYFEFVITESVDFQWEPHAFLSWNNPHPTASNVISDCSSSAERSDMFLQLTSKLTDSRNGDANVAPMSRKLPTQMSTTIFGGILLSFKTERLLQENCRNEVK
jgi:hypothetical protein